MILSVSRRTDIPNYYSDWFFNRIKAGFLYVRNPMNPHQISRINISPEVVDCIVFWTKNPANMLDKLELLRDYQYYFQFTLTGYGKDIEPGLPDKRTELIPIFRELSERIGKEKVIWRYDPIFLNDRYTMEYHLKAFEEIAASLAGFTEKVIISFIDIYAKMERKAKGLGIRALTENEMREMAVQMARIASKYHLAIESCAEHIDLSKEGIAHGHCIDRELIERIVGCKLTGGKDKNQRAACGCFESIEVGNYNTCLNGCMYCYANFSEEKVRGNLAVYDKEAEMLCGQIGMEDKVTERKVRSFKEGQISFMGEIS